MLNEITKRVDFLGARIISIEASLLDSKLINIFKRKEYTPYINELNEIKIELNSIQNKIASSTDRYYKALKELAISLKIYCENLLLIANGLNAKANNLLYSFGQYTQSLNLLDSLKYECQQMQFALINAMPALTDSESNDLYDLVSEEIQENTVINSMWVRFFAQEGGDINRTISAYIDERVNSLKNMLELPPDLFTYWNYYISLDIIHTDIETNLYYERGDGTIRTLNEGHIIDIPFVAINFPDGGLGYDPSRLDGLTDMIKNKGTYMPRTNSECDSVLSKTIAIINEKYNWIDVRGLSYDFTVNKLTIDYSSQEFSEIL